MSSGRRFVDYGPIALAVGAVEEARNQPLPADHLERDSNRFHSILSQACSNRKSPEQDRAFSLEGSDHDRNADSMAKEQELALELERLWTCNGSDGVREVRLRLADAFIPNTWVRIYNLHGELQVELTAVLEGTRQWLDRCASGLAADIGGRLQCSVSVVVQNAHGPEATRAQFNWEGAASL